MDDFSYYLGGLVGIALSYAYLLLPVVLLFFVIKGLRSLIREVREGKELEAQLNERPSYDYDDEEFNDDITDNEENENE